MAEAVYTRPNPGAPAAVAMGCSCPPGENCHGSGYMDGARDPETGERLFVMDIACPLHGRGVAR